MKMKYTDLLKEKKFLMVVLAQVISSIGSKLTLIALPIYAYMVTGTAEAISYMFVAETIPWVVLGPFCGYIIDGLDNKKTMIILNLVASFILFQYFYASINVLYVLAFFSGCCNVALASANGVVMSSFIEKEKFKLGYSLCDIAITIVNLVVPMLGGLLLTLTSANFLFLINGASFLFAGILISCIKFPLMKKEKNSLTIRSLFYDTLVQFKVLFQNIFVSVPLVFELVKTLAEAIILPLLVILIVELFAYPQSYYGFLISAISAGTLIGTFIAGKYFTGSRRLKYILIGGSVYFLSYALLTYNINFAFLMVVAIFGNVGNGIRTLEVHGTFFTETEEKTRGVALGIINSLISFFYAAGYILSIPMSEYFGIKEAFLVSAFAGGLIYLLLFIIFNSKIRRINEILVHQD